MDFVRSYFFPNATLTSCPFLSSKLDFPVIKTLERHFFYIEWVSLQCFGLQEDLILMKEMGNWSEMHSERSNFLQNPYFRGRNSVILKVRPRKNINFITWFAMRKLLVEWGLQKSNTKLWNRKFRRLPALYFTRILVAKYFHCWPFDEIQIHKYILAYY